LEAREKKNSLEKKKMVWACDFCGGAEYCPRTGPAPHIKNSKTSQTQNPFWVGESGIHPNQKDVRPSVRSGRGPVSTRDVTGKKRLSARILEGESYGRTVRGERPSHCSQWDQTHQGEKGKL